jgi:aspartyl-tRNA(Asn)/glutamyl-tRNA(Gln) amidotransferase subunit C
MEVNDQLVEKLAHLSRLRFSETETSEIKNDLQRMIAFVEKLNELNLEGIEPLLFMSEEVNVLREDEVKGSISRAEALKNAPLHDEKFFKVPKVIKK